MRFVFSSICLILFIQNSNGTVFKRCELAKKLLEKGFPSDKLGQWVCLIEAESGRMTSKKGGPNFDGSYDWGLFQINDKYWCRPGVAGGNCNTTCESLRLQDISIASRCAKMIYKRQGFSAWYGWRHKCQGKLPDLAPCSLSENTTQKTLHQKQDEHVKKYALSQLNKIVQ